MRWLTRLQTKPAELRRRCGRRVPAALGVACAVLTVAGQGEGGGGAKSDSKPAAEAIRRFELKPEQWWFLNLPGGQQFDASALLVAEDRSIWTVNDRGSTLYAIRFVDGRREANLEAIPDVFAPSQMRAAESGRVRRYDCEGLARDERGLIYMCEESERAIFRWDPAVRRVERLAIDWSPVEKYFSRTDRNASFEGIAVGGGKIYVANERSRGRIIVVDESTLRVESDFAPHPAAFAAFEMTYSDLAWFRGHLYVLMRELRCVLKVDPASRAVVAEYETRAIETEPELQYRSLFPTGNLEGLAVDDTHFWLLTDNNGQGRIQAPQDRRPALIRCARPDR